MRDVFIHFGPKMPDNCSKLIFVQWDIFFGTEEVILSSFKTYTEKKTILYIFRVFIFSKYMWPPKKVENHLPSDFHSDKIIFLQSYTITNTKYSKLF